MIPLLEQTQKNALIYKKIKKYLIYNFETYKFVKITYYISLNQLPIPNILGNASEFVQRVQIVIL